jgi:putative DeoR family transcriptional regulator (stage III sporulation protein D)
MARADFTGISNPNHFRKQVIIPLEYSYIETKCSEGVFLLKEYIEKRAIDIANYIIEHNTTVRQTAKQFGISKSTVHIEVMIQNGSFGR